MPEANKIKQDEVMVDIDTSGPETEVTLPEETVQETEKVEKVETVETVETETETKPETEKVETKDDEKLEEYSKGVQARIAKLTRKMRESERREKAAVEYAQAVEKKRQIDQERFNQVDSAYTKKFEDNVKLGMDSAQKELAMGDACYVDKERYPNGPWCKVGDWVVFARYAGSRIEIDGGEVRLLNEDEVLATVEDPTDILHKY